MTKLNKFGDEVSELRQDIVRRVLEVADAKANSETRTTGKQVFRSNIIAKVLTDWADSHIDEAILIVKLTGVNPMVSDKGAHVDD